MPFSLLPKAILPSLTDLTPEMLRQWDVRLLMLDYDNTIVPYTTDTPTPRMATWIRSMQHEDIQLCVVSNTHKPRVTVFCREYNLPCITHSRKPMHRGINECLKRFGTESRHAALVGDQIYTDVLGANTAGVRSILVSAISNHNFWLKARHVLELPFIFAAKKRRISV